MDDDNGERYGCPMPLMVLTNRAGRSGTGFSAQVKVLKPLEKASWITQAQEIPGVCTASSVYAESLGECGR